MDENTTVNDDLAIDQYTEETHEDELTTGEESEGTVEDTDEEKARLRAENAKLNAILKRRNEKGNQKVAPQASQKQNGDITTNQLSRDETYLVSVFGAKGLGYEDINLYLEKARKIAEIEGIPVVKAVETPYFKTFEAQTAEQKRIAKASLGASKGSGQGASQKTLATPDLSDQDFDRLLKENIAKNRGY